MEQGNPVQVDTGSTVAMLRAEIRKTIDSNCGESNFRGAMFCALCRPGFALHPQAPCRAGILTLEVHRAISRPLNTAAMQAAVAVELHMQAAYLFDSVADRDKGPSDDLSPSEELALAIGLLSCGQSALYEAAFASGRHGPGLRSLLRWAGDCAVHCSTGQFLDAYLEKRTMATTEEALMMTSLKAGSLGRFAAGLGASMATDDSDTVNLSGEFGYNLFTYLQLVDDLRDACKAHDLQGDLMQHKKTLPVVFFHNSLRGSNAEVVCSIIPPEESREAKADAWRRFESSGSRVFGAIAAEAFLNRAKSNLAGIRSRVGTVENLERIVSSFEITPQEVVNS